MKNTEFVTAYKGNQVQNFTRKSWDVLGTDKLGWSLIPEAPKEVAALAEKINNNESTATNDVSDGNNEPPQDKKTRKYQKRK